MMKQLGLRAEQYANGWYTSFINLMKDNFEKRGTRISSLLRIILYLEKLPMHKELVSRQNIVVGIYAGADLLSD